MLYIAENLKVLRKEKNFTQEEVAEILGVTAQSVSKWERGDTFPDITLLPALSNLYKVSVDALIGMDKINETETRTAIFNDGHNYLRNGDYSAAETVYSNALKTFPNDEGIMSELAFTLALDNEPIKLSQAINLCARVLSANPNEKVRHTTRAALCFIYFKAGEKENAISAAQNLPHIRESREKVLEEFDKSPTMENIDSYLKFIALGENNEQDIITVDFGINMVPICTEYSIVDKIQKLRNEIEDPQTNIGYRKLPQVRVRDNCELLPNQVRVRHYADYLLNEEFDNCEDATNKIKSILRKISQA